ncbi:hypothetical protein [Geothrix oryzae]|uniref:hypothetical protein n=1 Tax=Geothrix oryzae TaxID=2927975 RepID=UPI0025738C50|nr:hypothetical protein [Geothrix oryzae]
MPNELGYWTIGTHYLHLVGSACEELIKNENARVVIEPQIEGRPFSWAGYFEKTKWSDHTVGIAVLFNFFHGIEVTLKGFLSRNGEAPRHHRLTDLLVQFEDRYPGTSVGNLVRQFTVQLDPESPLGQFFVTNQVSVDDWYQALKYPESTAGQTFDHHDLKYGGQETVAFWKVIGQTSRQLCQESVALAMSLEPPPATSA